MQHLTGSLKQNKEGPKLTPFEQADYNLARFVLNAQLAHELESIVERLDALEKMKNRFTKLLESNENVTLAFSVKGRLSEIEEEIIATEFLLQAVCSTYNQEM